MASLKKRAHLPIEISNQIFQNPGLARFFKANPAPTLDLTYSPSKNMDKKARMKPLQSHI
jgi:hypothetical protein